MSDSINALLQGQRASTVLQGIANPPVVNPLAAISAGTQAASQVYDLRAKQANQALGQILQQSTDEQGNVDYQKAQSLAAGAGPIVQAGMQTYLTNNAQLRGAQIKQASELHNFVASNSASIMRDPSDENIDRIIALSKNMGIPDGGVAELQRYKTLSQPDRVTAAFNANNSNTDALHRLATGGFPSPTVTDLGGRLGGVTNTPPTPYGPGGVGETPGGATKGLTPGEATDIVPVHVPNGPDVQMPRALADRAIRSNPDLQKLNPGWDYHSDTGGQGGQAAPNSQRPWQPGGSYPRPQQGSQGGTGNAPPGQPGVNPGARVPYPPPQQTPQQGAPSPTFQPTAARADAAGQPVQTGPTRYGQSPPPGFGKQMETGANAAASLEGEAQNARSTTQPLLTAMLPELEAIKNTGAGQKTLSFIQQMAIRLGVTPPKFDPTKPQASMEALGKIFAQYQAAQLGALGAQPSDSRQTLAEATSPSMSYSSAGNRLIIHRLMGTNDALDTMFSAWMNSQTRATQPGNFGAWREAFTAPVQSGPLAGARFDPTVFTVNRLPQDDQKQYLRDLQKSSPKDYQQFTKNWALAIHEGWVKPLTGGGGG